MSATIPPFFREFPVEVPVPNCDICKTVKSTKRWVIKPESLAYPIAVLICDSCAKGPTGLTYHENVYGVKKSDA